MPNKALRFCAWPGCDELVTDKYCTEHKAKHEEEQQQNNRAYNRQRGSSTKQGYGYDWQQVRLRYLKQHPLCEDCLTKGKVVHATLVHHIKPILEGGARLNENNLKALCNDCHENIHGEDRWRRKNDIYTYIFNRRNS